MSIGLTDILVALGSFPLMEDVSFLGGLRAVVDITERDAIAAEYRKAGMFVFTQTEGQLWRLDAGLTNADWIEFTGGGGSSAGRDVFVFDPLATEDDRTFNTILGCLTAASNYSIATGRPVEVHLLDHATVSSGSNWAFERFTFRGFGGDPTDIKSLVFAEGVTINSTRLRFRDLAVTSTGSSPVWTQNADCTLELEGASTLSSSIASFANVGVARMVLITRDRSVLQPGGGLYLINGTPGSARIEWYQYDASWCNPGGGALTDPAIELHWWRDGVDTGDNQLPVVQPDGSFVPSALRGMRQVVPLRVSWSITSDITEGDFPFWDASEQIDVAPDNSGWNINSMSDPFFDSRSNPFKWLLNSSAFTVNIINNHGASALATRIHTSTGIDVALGPGDMGLLAYAWDIPGWRYFPIGINAAGGDIGVTKVNVTYSTIDDTPEIGYTYTIQGGNGTMIGVELHAYAGTNFSYAQYKVLALFKINADGVPSQENFQFIGTPFEGTPTWDIYFDYATTPNLRVMLVGEGADTTDWRIRGEITEIPMTGGGGGGA